MDINDRTGDRALDAALRGDYTEPDDWWDKVDHLFGADRHLDARYEEIQGDY